VRRDSWLRGRAVLKRLLTALGEADDTSALRFPHPRISLTHSGGWAVAVGAASGLLGIGVDLELRVPPRFETARRFLSDGELEWIGQLGEAESPRALLRLWTVKEAVYKADPGNGSASFRDYTLDDPAQLRGTVIRRLSGPVFRYGSFELPGGFLSLAILPADRSK
jgi:4'-phosphopantetheinyl transferase EntD